MYNWRNSYFDRRDVAEAGAGMAVPESRAVVKPLRHDESATYPGIAMAKSSPPSLLCGGRRNMRH